MTMVVEGFWRRLRFTRARDLVRGHVDGRLDWRRYLTDANLPDALKTIVEQVAARRWLWHQERIDIAQELVAHFQDGLETGATQSDLTESFGDASQAAQLILRAKRRNRPLWWQAWWWMSRGLAAFACLYLLAALWLGSVRPRISTDYLAALNQGVLDAPLQERAWPLYLQAARSNYVAKHGSDQGLARSPVEFDWAPSWDALTPTEVDAWLAERQELIRLLRSAASRPVLGTPLSLGSQRLGDFDPTTGELTSAASVTLDSDGIGLYGVLLGHLQTTRSYARTLQQDALRAKDVGVGDRITADLVAMHGMARHAAQQPFLISGLIAMAIDGMAFETLAEVLQVAPETLSNEQLKRLAHLIATIRYNQSAWMRGERIAFQDAMQRVYSDDGNGDGFLTAQGMQWLQQFSHHLMRAGQADLFQDALKRPAWRYAATPVARLMVSSRKETLAQFDELNALASQDLTTPLWKWQTRDGLFTSRVGEIVDGGLAHSPMIALLMPAYQASTPAILRRRGELHGALVGIALELYRREHDQWPESLDKLTPRWLPELPVDFINGGPVGYRLIDGMPVVYSLGVDTDDDGGKLPGYLRPRAEGEKPSPYPVRAPYSQEELAELPALRDNGDWVLWSLARTQYALSEGVVGP